MGIARRIAEVFEAKVNSLLGQVEDPREMVDYSYQRQQELLTDVRRGIVEVAASRRRARQQAEELGRSAAHLQRQAEQAAAAGSDELARQALTRRTQLLTQADEARQQESALRADEERLTATARRLQAKTEAFGLRKEVLKAGYTTARAGAGASEAVTGISEEMEDVGLSTRRAQDKTSQAQARADALDDLLATGALGEALPERAPPTARELQEQLDEVTTRAAVDAELARIKRDRSQAGDAGDQGPGGGEEAPGGGEDRGGDPAR